MQIDFPTLIVSQVKVRVIIIKEWDLEYWDGALWVNSNEAGQLELRNSTKPTLPVEAVLLPSLSKEVSVLLPEEPVITFPEVFCIARNW